MRLDIREIVHIPIHWVTYTTKSPPPNAALSTGANRATLRRLWWTIPKADRLQMRVFTRPSPKRYEMRCCIAYTTSIYASALSSSIKRRGARLNTIG